MRINIKLSKLNIISIAIVACIGLIIAAAGGTIAYFTDAKEMTNVYTAGGVFITLTEAAVKPDGQGNYVVDPNERVSGKDLANTDPTINNYGYVYPGMTIHKDPTIENVGFDSIWVAAKVIIDDGEGDLGQIYGDADNEYYIHDLFTGGAIEPVEGKIHFGTWNGIANVLYDTDNTYAIAQKVNTTTGNHEFFIFILQPLAKNESVTVFDTMLIDPELDNTNLQHFANLKITVQAFGVQKFGFSDCYKAMVAAFGTHFPFAADSSSGTN